MRDICRAVIEYGFFLSVSHAEDTVSGATAHKALEEIRQSISLSRERVAFLAHQVERLKKINAL